MARVDIMQLENALRGVKYPVTKDELVAHAEQKDADEQIRAALGRLPNHHFRSAGEVTKAIGAFSGDTRVSQ